MFDYLTFSYSGISESSADAHRDGAKLARQCLKKLSAAGNKDRFPPSLLILLASPAYLQRQKAQQLLNGINETFRETVGEVDLIGSSVGGVFFDQQVHAKGALLICLASTLITARVAFGANARKNPAKAITDLLNDLSLNPSTRFDPNPLDNRLILTFMPGCNRQAPSQEVFPAPELYQRFYDGVQGRIWMVGGVSSANFARLSKDGFQFAGRKVLRDSVVAASIVTGVPIGVSLNDGLRRTGRVLRVTNLARDKRTVLEFDGKPPREQLSNGNLMLAKLSSYDERSVDIPLPLPDGSLQMLKAVKRGEYFEVLRAESNIERTLLSGIEQAKRRVYVEKPIAGLIFPCVPYNPRTGSGIANFERALTKVERSLRRKSTRENPCVGGFFDGEIGVDAQGRSRLTNGGVGYLVFGDEIRERTPLYEGVSALAAYGHKLLAGADLSTKAIYVTIRNALEIITETGFPGAMLSLIVSNLDRERSEKMRYIIAREAVGARFTKIKDLTKREFEGTDILAVVARKKQPRFIPDSRKNRFCDRKATRESGLISQYVLPLKRLDGTVFGTLQVDLGDLSSLSHKTFSKTEKARMLNCFAEVFSASINRIANAVENNIKIELDKALESSLAANDFHAGVDNFFKAAGKAFGVEMGQLRLVHTAASNKLNPTLVLETGFGLSYEAEKSDRQEVRADEFSPICSAFRSNDCHIVNDTSMDPAFRAMLKKAAPNRLLVEALRQTKSYAAVGFKDEHGSLGAISLGSTQPWYFLKLHRTSLEVLAERLGFLVEHLKTKIAHNFLLAVSPKLAKRNLNDAERIFRSITDDFRRALNAETASLYLWDQDTKRYVLRAESNWKDKRWVHAAKYEANSGWIGVTAVNEEPFYVPDLQKYYLEHNYDFPSGRYAEHMFGQPLSDSFTVEAIALPLSIGSDKESKFGVLTFYRRCIKEARHSGFVTTDIKLLTEGANNAAGLVNAVLWHRKEKWEEQEQYRKNRTYREISSGDDQSFEAKICRAVLKSYKAVEVDFYRINRPDEALSHTWIAGYRMDVGSKRPQKLSAPSANHHDLIKQTVQPKKPFYRVVSLRHQPKNKHPVNPSLLKTEDAVEQSCVPLIGDKRYIGALVVRWRVGASQAFSLPALHDSFHLQVLGRIIGSTFSKQQVKKRAERSKQAVHTAGLYVFQHAHRLVNAIEDLYGITQRIKHAENDFERKRRIDQMERAAEDYIERLDWVFDLGELIQNPTVETLHLRSLIDKCRQDAPVRGSPRVDVVKINVQPEILILADPKLLREVFINLISNAIDAVNLKKSRAGVKTRLEFKAIVAEDQQTVDLIIRDNGIGMSRGQVRAALRGFGPPEQSFGVRHKGVGVLISQYLLHVQNGSLAYKSVRGKGTDAIVTLPYGNEGTRDEMEISN